MASVDISQVPELVDSTAYPVMFERYEAVPLVYPSLGMVLSPNNLSTPLYGHKSSVISGFEDFTDREDGQEIEAGTFDSAYSWYLKARQKSKRLDLPGRMLRASDGQAKTEGILIAFARKMGENGRLHKENFIADMFQKGTLTAGDAAFFDGSHPGNADPYPKFIYDGLPWFDTAHTITGAASTYANHTASGLALTQANLQTVLTTMTSTNAVDERGQRIMITPTILMVPPALEYTARVILQTSQAVGGANNDINPIAGSLRLVVNRALDDSASSASWWVGAGDDGLTIADSGAPRFRTAYDSDTDVVKVYAEFEFGAAVPNWRYWYCANKAAS